MKVEAAERAGRLQPGSVLVESSSGNLGVALSMIAESKGYGFVCVTGVRCNTASRRMMEVLGVRVHVVREPDPQGGYLGARIGYVRDLCASASHYVWLDQYGARTLPEAGRPAAPSAPTNAPHPARRAAPDARTDAAVYPARARVGEDCLLATKVMVPIDGHVRQGVGLLGSPSFETSSASGCCC